MLKEICHGYNTNLHNNSNSFFHNSLQRGLLLPHLWYDDGVVWKR